MINGYRTIDERLDQLERNVRVLQWSVVAHGIGIAAIILGVAG